MATRRMLAFVGRLWLVGVACGVWCVCVCVLLSCCGNSPDFVASRPPNASIINYIVGQLSVERLREVLEAGREAVDKLRSELEKEVQP